MEEGKRDTEVGGAALASSYARKRILGELGSPPSFGVFINQGSKEFANATVCSTRWANSRRQVSGVEVAEGRKQYGRAAHSAWSKDGLF